MNPRRSLAMLALPLAAFALTACGNGSPESASTPRASVAVESSNPSPVASQASTDTPSCWSMADSTWMDDYNKLTTKPAAALVVLDALPPIQAGCTPADVADLLRAHDLAANIREHSGS